MKQNKVVIMDPIKPNKLTEAKKELSQYKGIEAPTEINKADIGYMHLLLVTPLQNKAKTAFNYKLRKVQMTVAAYNRSNEEVARQNKIVILLHDAREKEAASIASAIREEKFKQARLKTLSPAEQLSTVLNNNNEVAALKAELESLKSALQEKVKK